MKKILAIILALTLVIGMIPAAFATSTGESDTLEYVFSKKAAGGTTATYDSVETAGISKNKWASAGYNWYYGGTLADDLWYITMQQVRVEQAAPISFGVKINVDKTGYFKPELEFLKSQYGAKLDMYILNAEDVKDGWDMEASNSKATLGMGKAVEDYIANGENSVVKKLITSENTYKDGAGADQAKYDSSEVGTAYGEPIEFTKTGDYYVIFGVSGADESALTSGSKACYYIRLSGLKFNKITPASIEVSADTTEIDVGGTAKLTSVVKTADGTQLSAKVNYTSSNANVTVDANGNVTAGKVPGTATITATVDGTAISDTVTIKVTKSYNYVFWASARTEGKNLGATEYLPTAAGGLGYNMVEGESEPWDILAQYGTSSMACRKKENATRFSVKAASGDTINRNVVVYKIKFNEKGKYVPTLYYQTYANGGKVNLYLVPATWMDAQDIFNQKDTAGIEGKPGVLDNNNEAAALLGYAQSNNKLVGTASTYSTDETVSINVVGDTTFAETEITEDEYYLAFSMSGAEGEPAANGNYYAYISSLSFKKVGEVENVEAPTVALAVAYGNEDPTVTSYPRGKAITLTAPDKTAEGLTFRHWVRGTADGGDWITNDATYSFTLASNTYLTAVYTATAAETDKIVEFWGGNGEYITEKIADADGKVEFPDKPTMTGFKFLQWIVAKDEAVNADTVFTSALTRVVADYEDDVTTFEVDGDSLTYDAKVHKDADEEKAWYRDGVLVGYGASYDYHVWDAVGTIEARDISGQKTPIVVLDNTVKEEKACMIEYDTAGKNVTEVGIVFGSRTATVESCNSKATSQKKLSHGQFTAKPNAKGNADFARGYIIYNDAGVYRVAYTEAVALN